MPPVFAGANAVYIHDHEASQKMVVEFARNRGDFALNNYIQVVPATKPAGYYLEMTVEQAGRILNADLREFVWADNADAPDGNWGLESFEWKPFECRRYAYPFRMGHLAAKNATWDIVAQHSRIAAQQAMTGRTVKVLDLLTTSGNWPASHVLNVTTIPGNSGNWAQSTTQRQDIRRSLITGCEKILDDTLGAVKPADLRLVISSGLAGKIAQSQEIVDYIKGSPDALAQIRGELPGRNVIYGLPNRLYGFELFVEDARKVTTAKGVSPQVKTAVLGDTLALLVSRPGGLEGVSGAPSFSTVTVFAVVEDEMRVEIQEDSWNRVTRGRVVDHFDVKLTAPSAGILFTNCS
jgi:hypothetical protein